ncbi:SWIM zinc finger family protein [Actinacidiphila sp. SB3-2]
MNGSYEARAANAERVVEAPPPARGRGFAETWWGRAWIQALEDTALDGQQLRKGRALARQGGVGAVSVRPGGATAVVRGRDGTGYRADVLLRELETGAWDRLVEAVVAEAGHLAALLDRELPPHLAEDAAGVGVELLPGIGELEPRCTCEAWDHCVHTAALSYQLARLLDRDPLLLLLLRGRGVEWLVDEVQGRGTGTSPAAPEGVPADEAYALGAVLPPLPAPPAPPAEPGRAPLLSGGSPPAAGLDVAALEFLAGAAAVRARRMLLEALGPGHGESAPSPALSVDEDAASLLSLDPPLPVRDRLSLR